METPKAFGPFEVRGELGRGSGGVAYMAWHPGDDRTVAVKLYSAAPRDATGTIGRVKRDAQAAGALGHPNIAAVLGVGEHDGCPWVATEFVPGVSLAQVMRGRALLPIERVLDVWRQMCEGLAHAHREGVLHLDLKPSDVRLAPSGEVKLLDFGSWHVKALEHGVTGPLDGGLHYRAPELLIGRRPDRRADVFSVAAIVYELVAYRKAFPGDSTTDVVRLLARCEPDLACLPRSPFTPGFERVLAASLARSLDARHSAFEEVHADLVQLVRETAPRLRPPSDSGEAGPPEREELLANVTRARAEDRLEDALEGCRLLLDRDSEDEAARRAMSEIEAVLVEREVDALVGMALAYAADGDIALATSIAEKVERLAPWSPRYLQLQVYLDEEAARRQADTLVASALEHLAAGRIQDARDRANEASLVMPGHPQADRLLHELGPEPTAVPVSAASPALDLTATLAAEAATAATTSDVQTAEVHTADVHTAEPAPGAAAAGLAATETASTEAVTAELQPVAPSEAVQAAVIAAPPEPAAAETEAPVAAATPDPEREHRPEPEAPPGSASAVAAPAAVEAAPLAPVSAEAAPPAPEVPAAPAVVESARAKPLDPRLAEAVTLSAAALHHFLKDDHVKAKAVVERALELDPENRRAMELLKILRVLG